ncbi:restriction endonuclease subunit S [Nocardia sp. IBHARD005]|uniref:restriction endonuclease subunit S n=1 Tax=Nocardia sp. IBHARD005 TaxID=3457765 RepID=UPI004059AB98
MSSKESGYISWPSDWRTVPLWSMFERMKDVGHPQEDLLSVYREHGVVRRDGREDNFNKAALDRSIYQLVYPGWFVVNRMKAWQGSVGISPLRGIVSGHYICFRPNHGEDPGYLNWLLRSGVYATEYYSRSRGVRPSQVEIDNDELRVLPIHLPPLEEQRRIADFLDAETSRIDQIIRIRRDQLSLVDSAEISRVFDAIRGREVGGRRKDSGIPWLGSVPESWRIAAVSYSFDVELGKMLNQDRVEGEHLRPYLRVANVQWDSLDLETLAHMDFPPEEQERYRLRFGDLLVCEGGRPGRAAIWDGSTTEMYYQKALHRIRSRGNDLSRWLYYCLLVAERLGVFAVQGNTSTITHLTREQLKPQRFPFPDPSLQETLVAELDIAHRRDESMKALLVRQTDLLDERRQALITAAVTGQFDVSTASGRNTIQGV